MAEKKAKKQPAGGVSETVYIPHEEMPHGNGAPVLQPTVATVDQQIKLELAKFTLADAGIAQLKKNYEGLEISGADDKEGYKKVREAWRDVQSKRTGLEKKGLELRGGYGVITKAIKAEEDRLVDLITPLEDGLHKKWKAIDDEKERVKKEQEQAEQKAEHDRTGQHTWLDCTTHGGSARQFVCVYCEARKEEPFDLDDAAAGDEDCLG